MKTKVSTKVTKQTLIIHIPNSPVNRQSNHLINTCTLTTKLACTYSSCYQTTIREWTVFELMTNLSTLMQSAIPHDRFVIIRIIVVQKLTIVYGDMNS